MLTKATKAIITIIIAIGGGCVFSACQSWWSVLIVLAAMIGGMVVFLGLWIEHEADEEEKRIHLLRVRILKSKWGWRILMIGIGLEVVLGAVVASWDALENWENAPENRPISTISATAFLTFKLDHEILNPAEDTSWHSTLEFLEGTNIAKQVFGLAAENKDIEPSVIAGLTNCVLFEIHFHQFLWPPGLGFAEDKGLGQPEKSFSKVGSFIVSMPQITNAEVVSGSITVNLNTSPPWTFEIPPQKQRFGFISGKMTKIGRHEIKTDVFQFPFLDWQAKATNFFDGK